MAMVCPQCNGSFQQRLNCPQCGVRLHYRASHVRRSGVSAEESDWQATPWGRVVAGLLLAQGLYYVLQHLSTAGLLAARERAPLNVWATLTGLLVLQGFQAVGVLSAGLLVGAGQRRGGLYGALTGVWNGVLFTVVQHWIGHPVSTMSLLGEPILQAAFGALGGTLGSHIWQPLPSLASLDRANRSVPPNVRMSPKPSYFAGPVAWGRVLTGITLAVGGVVWVDVIRELILQASGGRLQIDTQLQADLVTWEISALAMLAGSMLAGATTFNGLKQGLAVGVGTAVVLAGVGLAGSHVAPHLLLLTVMSAVCLSLAGGWFGTQLLPPLFAPRRSKRISAAPL